MNGSHNLDLLSKVIRQNKTKYDLQLNLNPYRSYYNTYLPLTHGKFENNFEIIPSLPFERIYERGYYLSEPNFLPFTSEMAIKVLNSTEYLNIYDPKDPFFVADKAMYHLVADKMDSTNKYLNILEGELYSTDSTLVYKNKEELIFNYYRVKASIARRLDQNVDVLKYLDTIYSNIIPIENFLDILYEFYGGLKIMEAETLIDLGELERAKLIYTNCEKLIWNSNSLYILYTTPLIKYRLGYIYYLQGDFEKAAQFFKYFVDIYKECDDSYQHHVRYAEEKIQEYVESIQ
jgi:tetratricopeptide (TPR) repeat protein